MKCYLDESSFRLIGKGWEIRHMLRRMTAEGAAMQEGRGEAGTPATVAAYLGGTPTRIVKLVPRADRQR